MLDSSTLRRSVWLAALALVIHELEEWNIAAWFAARFRNPTGMSPHVVWLGLVVASTVALL